MNLTIKRGDTRNAIKATLAKDSKVVNLDDCTVLFYMSGKVDGVRCQVLDDGSVMYPLEASTVDASGVFRAEFKVIYPDGRVDTFPNNDYIKINIMNDLKE